MEGVDVLCVSYSADRVMSEHSIWRERRERRARGPPSADLAKVMRVSWVTRPFLLSWPVLKHVTSVAETLPLEALSSRASSLLETLVEMHIREVSQWLPKICRARAASRSVPQPFVTSCPNWRTGGFWLHHIPPLEECRTALGYRFFVDSLLQVGPVEEGASRRSMPARSTAVPVS